MPSTRSHRIALAVTVAVLLALGGLMYLGAQRYRNDHKQVKRGSTLSVAAQRVLRHQITQGGRTSRPPAAIPPAAPSGRAALASAPAVERQQSPAPPAEDGPLGKPTIPVLKLAAMRGDCWAEVRKVSESGAVVYAGIIAKGDTKTFRGKTLWVRLGAPEAIDASVDGAAADIPKGTLNVLVTRRGIAAAA